MAQLLMKRPAGAHQLPEESPVAVRAATSADAEGIARLLAAAFPEQAWDAARAMHDLFEEVKLDQEPDILGELQDTFVGFINLFLKQRIEELQAKVVQEGLSSEETQELMMLIREVQIEKRNENGA